SDNDKHSRFKQAMEKMQKQAFFQIKEEQGKGFKFKSIEPIPYAEWTDYNDEVKIEFHREIMPYLINLKKNFTQHALSDIAELNSKYSIILYRWLSMQYNQYKLYSVKGARRAEHVVAYGIPFISIKELLIMTDTVISYKEFTRFDNDVLKPPLHEINAHTSFNVTYN